MTADLKFSIWALLVLLAGAANLAADWQPFHARYAVYRNGKLSGKADITLEQRGERWVLHTSGNGTHGLARFLHVTDTEQVEGFYLDGRFRPEQYTHHTRVAGIDRGWTALFDWPSNTVNIFTGKMKKNEDALSLNLGPGALDPLSLKLELQRRLRDQEADMLFHMVDDDEIKEQTYRVLQAEKLETSLGCLNTMPVERIRTNSTRYTRAWHAPDLDFITVRMEHGKTDGDHMEMRITELVQGGREVTPSPGCAANQRTSAQP